MFPQSRSSRNFFGARPCLRWSCCRGAAFGKNLPNGFTLSGAVTPLDQRVADLLEDLHFTRRRRFGLRLFFLFAA